MHYCARCDFYFAWPLLPVDPVQLFSDAYRGAESRRAMGDFAKRMERRGTLITNERIGLWSPAYWRTLDYLSLRYPHGARVLEVGPGVGAFMHALWRRGHTVRGLDVGGPVVEALRGDGFPMHHGEVSTVPNGLWADTQVVATFFALHHIQQPVEWLRSIRDRWPHAVLIVGGYKPITPETAEERNYPPRTWGWWSPTALTEALREAGYASFGWRLPLSTPEIGMPRWMMRAGSGVAWLHPSIRHGAAAALDVVLRRTRWNAGCLWMVAEPCE